MLYRIAILTSIAVGLAAGQTASPEQIQQLTAQAEQVKALLQSGDLRTASKQLRQLESAVYKIIAPVPSTPEQQFQKAETMLSRKDPVSRFMTDAHLGLLALNAAELDKADAYGRDLLSLAPQFVANPAYGNAVSSGNLLTGRVALQRDRNVVFAKAALLAAGNAPATSLLQKFGPNMGLARDLLAAGERDTVLEYFALCRKFWTEGQGKLDQWTAMVKSGGIPDFGANLLFQ